MQREILVIANEKLFSTIKRESKIYDAWNDFESIILKDYEYMVRSEAEEDFNYKQPIPYAVVVNEKNEIFVYKRGWSGSNAGESRLHSKIAIWIWGHIEREDEDSGNLLVDSLKREIEEELYIKESAIKESFPVWYINQDDGWVSEVHFGIGYIVRVSSCEFQLLDGELESWEFMNYQELIRMIESWDYDVEWWTKMLAPEIKKYV